MQLFRHSATLPRAFHGCVLAIGNFDGVHLGHRAVLDEALGLARQHQVPCMVMTFHPHPKRFFAPDSKALSLEPRHMKWRRLRGIGIDGVLSQPFNAGFAAITADDFISHILVGHLHVTHVVVGENFHFGQGRQGTIALLQQGAMTHRFGFTYVPPAMHNGEPISSSRVRKAIAQGDMELAGALLGRPYQLYGRVRHGDKRGRTLGTPTANISISGIHPPAYGVYAVQCAFTESTNCAIHPPVWHKAVANIGVRPTFGEGNIPLCEVHVLAPMYDDRYGDIMRVRLLHHLRAEQAFADEAALKAQISRDIAAAHHYLKDV